MRLVESSHRLHGAGLCFLCETAIRHPDEPVVNTNFEFDPPFQTPLTGEKYVCNSCADSIARTLGFIPEIEIQELVEELEVVKGRLSNIKTFLKKVS